MPKKKKKFTPNRKQKAFIDKFFSCDEISIDQVCEELNIENSTVEKWFNNPGFMTWAKRKLKSILNRGSLEVYRSVLSKAKRGDIQATKLIFKIMDDDSQNLRSDPNYEILIDQCGIENDDR